jgi:peptide/nickel transport system substrate-binding protein
VTIRQSAPNVLFLPVMTHFVLGIFDKETMEEHATDDDPWSHEYANNENAPSFGPYCIERWEKEQEFIVTANPDYYRGVAAIQRIVYRKVPQSSNRVAALRSGDAQLVEHLTPREFDSLRETDGVAVAGVVGNETLFLHLNWNTPPFDDVRVRQAIAHAIPYDEIIDAGYFGQARTWEGQVPSSAPGFHRPATQYTYDPARAAALLADAGYPNGEGLDAFGDVFRLSYVAEKESTLGPIATITQAALNEAGLPFTLDPIPNSQFADRMFSRRDLPAALNDQEKPVVVEAGYAMQIWHLSLENGAVANNNNYANPEVDDLIVQAREEGDADARAELLREAQEIVHNQANFVPIVEWRTQWAFDDAISGITWHPENSLRWYELSLT